MVSFLEKPIDEYQKFNAYIDKNINLSIRCFVWFPKSFQQEEPHVYLYACSEIEYKKIQRYLNPKESNKISLDIPMTRFGNPEPYGFYLFKDLYFSQTGLTLHAKNWAEGFFKYHWPAHAISTRMIENAELESSQVITLFHTPSKLLESHVSTMTDYNGEVKRLSSHCIEVAELDKLGIKSITTEKYIGNDETYVLEIEPQESINSVLAFNKRIKPIANLIFAVTSFLERKKINWNQASFSGLNHYYEIFNTRTVLNSKKRDYPLVESYNFLSVLTKILQNTVMNEVDYKTALCLAYVSGLEYSVNSKIILWNSLLEKILKRHKLIKKDQKKAEGIATLAIPISDISSIKNLINIRNDIAHGDEITSDKLFKLGKDWELLIERLILSELGFSELAMTHLKIKP